MSSEFHSRVVAISGPSGVGKSTIIHGAMEQIPAIKLSVSFTTRQKREGEEEGRDYYFIGRETFEAKIAEGEYLEWAQVFDNYYGTGKTAVQEILGQGLHALLDVDTQGALSIKALSTGVVFVFIRPPSLKDLETRLRGRGSETEESLARRLSRAESEMARAAQYDHIIVNDDAGRATDQLVAIIRDAEWRAEPFQVVESPGKEALSGASASPAAAESTSAKALALSEKFAVGLAGKLGPGLRAEMVAVIGDHLRAVLDRDLNGLVQEALQTYRRGGP